ncbi:MAG: hypothetical protein MRQ09_04970 [Candidatus Midichloria sp.]|nr:hypothetical protein [Candidatus Midichloria sp.]
MWLIKNISANFPITQVNPPSYDVVVPAASIAMTNVGEYIDSLNVLEIKTTGWDETSYDI